MWDEVLDVSTVRGLFDAQVARGRCVSYPPSLLVNACGAVADMVGCCQEMPGSPLSTRMILGQLPVFSSRPRRTMTRLVKTQRVERRSGSSSGASLVGLSASVAWLVGGTG